MHLKLLKKTCETKVFIKKAPARIIIITVLNHNSTQSYNLPICWVTFHCVNARNYEKYSLNVGSVILILNQAII